MDIKELKTSFDEISKQVKKETKGQPVLATLFNTLLSLFKILFELFAEQSKKFEEQNRLIEKLTGQYANKAFDSRKANDETINGRRSEKKKGVNSADKNHDKDIPKEEKAKPQKAFKTEQQVKVIGYNGEELTKEEAEQKIGTVFEGIDGKRYRYTRTLASSVKTEIDITLLEIQYYKLEYEPVDEQGNAVAVSQRQTAVCAKTDYLKKTQVSVSLMSFVLYLWIGLKDPVYRIANALYEYGVTLSKQQIYKDINITACLLMPIFKHMESYIRLEKQIGIDETYHSTRERRLLTKSPPDDRTKSKKHKSQKSKAKTLRTYFYAVIGGKYVCLYYHDPYRDSDIPKEILKKNGLAEDAFVTSDGFYKVLFNLENAEGDEAKELFQHGICWIHVKRYYCILLNYGMDEDGNPCREFEKMKWEQDLKDAQSFVDKISNAFHICNDITARCKQNPSLDIVVLKNRELRPLIEEICADARRIYADITTKKDEEPKRQCSKKLKAAIGYIVNNEAALKTFLDSPYGLMHNNAVESRFRELDILRNSMLASDTFRGADNLALFYSLYKTAQMHGVEFERYMRIAISVMTEHMSEIEFEKDNRGTIIGYKSDSISKEVLESVMPWNLHI